MILALVLILILLALLGGIWLSKLLFLLLIAAVLVWLFGR